MLEHSNKSTKLVSPDVNNRQQSSGVKKTDQEVIKSKLDDPVNDAVDEGLGTPSNRLLNCGRYDNLDRLDPDHRAVYAFLSDRIHVDLLDEGPFHKSWSGSTSTPTSHSLRCLQCLKRDSIQCEHQQNFRLQDVDLQSVLLRAVFLDKLAVVDICLKNDVDLQHRDESGRSALHYAAAAGLSKMTEYLIKCLRRKAGLFDENEYPNEAMERSGKTRNYETRKTEYCNRALCGINERDLKGWTPLLIAICKEQLEVVRVLLAYGADITLLYSHNSAPCRETPTHSRAIHFAAMRCNFEMIQLLRNWGASGKRFCCNLASVEAFACIIKQVLFVAEDVDECGRHPLHYAAARGRTEFISELLAVAPQSVSASDRHHRTPVHVAALRGYSDVVKLLIESKQHLNLLQKDIWDLDPYSLALSAGHLATVGLLLIEAETIKELCQQRNLNVSRCSSIQSRNATAVNCELSQLEETILEVLATGLQEPDHEQLARCLKRLGAETCLTLYKDTLQIQEKGGLSTSSKTRKKTAGGVFFGLIHDKVKTGGIPKEDWTYIRAIALERHRAKRRVPNGDRRTGSSLRDNYSCDAGYHSTSADNANQTGKQSDRIRRFNFNNALAGSGGMQPANHSQKKSTETVTDASLKPIVRPFQSFMKPKKTASARRLSQTTVKSMTPPCVSKSNSPSEARSFKEPSTTTRLSQGGISSQLAGSNFVEHPKTNQTESNFSRSTAVRSKRSSIGASFLAGTTSTELRVKLQPSRNERGNNGHREHPLASETRSPYVTTSHSPNLKPTDLMLNFTEMDEVESPTVLQVSTESMNGQKEILEQSLVDIHKKIQHSTVLTHTYETTTVSEYDMQDEPHSGFQVDSNSTKLSVDC